MAEKIFALFRSHALDSLDLLLHPFVLKLKIATRKPGEAQETNRHPIKESGCTSQRRGGGIPESCVLL